MQKRGGKSTSNRKTNPKPQSLKKKSKRVKFKIHSLQILYINKDFEF